MNPNRLDSHEEATTYLANNLRLAAGPPQLSSLIADACSDAFSEVSLPELPPGTMGMMMLRRKWVIRDDDLKLTTVFAGAVSTWVACALAAAMPAGTIVAALGAVFILFQSAFRKGVSLTDRQCSVLLALQNGGDPASVETMASHLTWSIEQVEAELEGLTRARCADGSIVAIVSQDGAGLWGTAGV